MAKGILIAAMDFTNVAEDEFNDWYDTEHIPERQRVPGFLTCQRWIGAEDPKQSVATYDLESLSVLQGAGYRAIGGENLSPWSKRITAKVERLLRYEGEQILPGDAVAPANAGGLLLVGMTPAADVEAAFNAWYDKEHVHALARVPGVLCARRFRTGGGGPKYLAIYALEENNVLRSAAFLDTVRSQPSPERTRFSGGFVGRNYLLNGYRQIFPARTDPIERTMGQISDSTRAKILGLNCARFLGLSVPAKYQQ